MFKRTQKGELAVTLSIIGLLVSLIGITVGSLSSLQLQSRNSSAQDIYAYKSTLEIREGSINGPVINFEPGFTWSNGLPEGKTGAVKGDIKMANSPKAQLIWNPTATGGVTQESGLRGKAVTVQVAIPEGWEMVDRFCEDKNSQVPTCNNVQSFHRLDMFSNIVITNGAEIVYGVVVKRKGAQPPTATPGPLPTAIPPTATPSPSPSPVPASCPVVGANCAPQNVRVTEDGLNEKSVEVTWDMPSGCPAYTRGVNPFWIDVANIGKAYHSGYIACAAQSTDTTSTCTLGKEQLPGRLLKTDSYEFTQKKWVDGQDYNVNVFTYNAAPSCVSPANTTSFKYEADKPEPQPNPTSQPAPSHELVCSNRCVFSEQKPGDKVRCYKGACPADQPDCGGGVENVNHGCEWAGAGTKCNFAKEEVKCDPEKPGPMPEGDVTLTFDTTTGYEFYDQLKSNVLLNIIMVDGKEIGLKNELVQGTGISNITVRQIQNIRSIKVWFSYGYPALFRYQNTSGRAGFITFNKLYEGSSLVKLIDDAKKGGIVRAKSLINIIMNNQSTNNGAVPQYFDTRQRVRTPDGSGSKSITARVVMDKDLSEATLTKYDQQVNLYIVHDSLATDLSFWNSYDHRQFYDYYPEGIADIGALAGFNVIQSDARYKFGPIADGWYIVSYLYGQDQVKSSEIVVEGCEKYYRAIWGVVCLMNKKSDSDNVVTFNVPVNAQPKQLSMGTYMITDQNVDLIDSSKSSLQVCSNDKCIDVPSESGRMDMAQITQATQSLGSVAYLSCTITTPTGETIHCPNTNPSYEQTQYIKVSKAEDGYSAAIVNESELADLDGDNSLTGIDLATVMDGYPSPEGDINRDGKTDARDLAISIGLLGQKVMPSTLYSPEMKLQRE